MDDLDGRSDTVLAAEPVSQDVGSARIRRILQRGLKRIIQAGTCQAVGGWSGRTDAKPVDLACPERLVN